MDIFKVGDKVKCAINGEGIVFSTRYNMENGHSNYPIGVGFPNGKVECYTLDGRELVSKGIVHPIILEVIEEPKAFIVTVSTGDNVHVGIFDDTSTFTREFNELPIENVDESVND